MRTEHDPARPILHEAMDRHRSGDRETARRLYEEHLASHPDDADALCLLGALEGEGGNHAGAEQAYRRALELNPNYGPAYAGLGTSFLLQERPAEAAEALAQAVELAPDQPEPRLHYTVALQRCGRLLEARQALTDFVGRWPDHLESRHNLGLLMLQTDSPDAAAAEFRFVLEQAPSRLSSWMGLARALIAANDPAGAEVALDSAKELASGDPGPLVLRGTMLQGKGRYREARAAFEEALELAPGNVPAIIGLAELDLAAARPESGLERLEAIAKDSGRSPAVMAITASLLAAIGRREEAIRRIDDWLGEGDMTPQSRAGLLKQRGRILDDMGEYDAAWQAWSQARQQAPRRIPAGHFSYAVDRLVQAYDAGIFNNRNTGESAPWTHSPLLIVGAPRSGKSLLEQVLSCHPEIRGAGELRVLGRLSNEIARRYGSAVRPYPDCIGSLGDGDIDEFRQAYRQAIGRHAGDASWVTDTQPTNFLHIGLAAILAPDLKVIHCRRDPVDTAWACISRQFADPGLDFVATPTGFPIYMRGLDRLMRHWEQAIPLQILEISYEDLVTSTRQTLERIVAYVGMDWDDSLMSYAEPGRADVDSAPVLTGPLNDEEIGRGRPYAERIGIDESTSDDHHVG